MGWRLAACSTYLLPAIKVHAGELAVVGLRNVDVEGLALVDERSTVGCHLKDGFLGDFPHSFIELLQVHGDLWDILKGIEMVSRLQPL